MYKKDVIVAAIHNYREEYAKSFNYDLQSIFNDLKQKQDASGHKIVKLPIQKNVDRKSEFL